MDSLEEVIDEARFEWAEALEPAERAGDLRTSFAGHLATAVRTWLVSEENVESAAGAMADEVNLSLAAFDDRTRSKYLRQARAALTALLPEELFAESAKKSETTDGR